MTPPCAPHLTVSPPWWQHPATLSRFVRDLLQAEMAQLRPAGWASPASGWHEGLHWQHDLGADSLELMALSTALADAVQLRDPDAAASLYTSPTLGNWQAVAHASLQASPGQMRFHTSGSTGAPKSCAHSTASLMQEMQAMAAVIGPVQRIVSAVRCHHIYGFLFTVLLPHAMGRPDLPLLDLQGKPPLALGALLAPGDLVIGFPEWWRAVGRSQHELPGGITGITSTAPCPDDVCEPLLAAGLARLLHIYGSSETSGVGWRDWPAPGYMLHPFWERVPDQPQQLRRLYPDGEQSVVCLQDEITWLDSQRFTPGPRLDGAVQIGGINVHMGQVRQSLLRHEAVADVALRLHPFGDQSRLKAFVVPKPEAQADGLAAQLQQWGQRHLAPAARPVHYTVGSALPVNTQGKACDWPVQAD
jgi:long-chain acyl-CoA synthetase